MSSLDGAAAVITGASSGIGEATAHALAERGANVVLVARRREALESVADDVRSEYGIDAVVADGDVRDSATSQAAVEAAVDEFGGLDVAVVNAGLGRGSDVATMTDEEYFAMQETNVDGAFFLTREALPHLTESEGTLVAVGSFAGEYPRSFNPVYAATKWWLRGFAHSVAAQAGDDGVAVSVVNPSEVRTEFGSEDGEPFEERFEPGSATEPEEVAEAIAFAASRADSSAQEIDLFRRDKFADTL
ncbi:oxidoreductase [Halorubrum californiense DSM 19288]|uniref:Oxidoreductase n=1 Tax=Halorubrum californiense DSM 19288 TaxID=1227465 RepID=M0E9V4_9EURY|nr:MULTISPECIES: SDR family oxidoreductase [Halorubrum]ELZ44566.1 oxidoreductase [Halorubrum californiense DSM 19288]TKX72001.1 SDR family oxidoreductase [Halorubrum sp. GN11GM_10-3_MGM]